MATIRDGNRQALVVVDVQVGVMAESWDAARIAGNVARAVAKARDAGVPVVWVQHANDQLVVDSDAWQWVPELVPAPGEARVHKRFNSAFEDTALEQTLAAQGVGHVVLAGAQTNWCIRSTAYGALDRGYDLTLVADAHTTGPIVLDDGFSIEPESVVRELNLAMTWTDYPGRTCRTAAADALEFGAAPASS